MPPAHAAWRTAIARIPTQQQTAMDRHRDAVAERLRRLAGNHMRCGAECERGEQAVDAANVRLDEPIRRFAAGEAAVNEYVGIAFGDPDYPFDIHLPHLSVRRPQAQPGDLRWERRDQLVG